MGESAALETMSKDELPAEAADPFSESQNDLNRAIEELSGIDGAGATSTSGTAETSGPNLNVNASDLIWDIPVEINIIMGSASLTVARLMELENGEVVELDRRVGEPLDIAVNGRNVAKGEIVLMDNDPAKFAIQVTELVGR